MKRPEGCGEMTEAVEIFEVEDIALESLKKREMPQEFQVLDLARPSIYSQIHPWILAEQVRQQSEVGLLWRGVELIVGELDPPGSRIERLQLVRRYREFDVPLERIVYIRSKRHNL